VLEKEEEEERKLMRKILTGLASVAMLTLAVTACHGSSGTKAESSAKAFASSSQGAYDKAQAEAAVKKCFPAQESKQLALAEPSKGKAARKAVEACLAIPPANRTAFDDALLNALLKGHVTTKAGRTQLAEVTIPELVVKYR
jgi:Flp pilus assembly protein TadD